MGDSKIFQWLKNTGEVAQTEMRRVFNMGIGLCVSDFTHQVFNRKSSDPALPANPLERLFQDQVR